MSTVDIEQLIASIPQLPPAEIPGPAQIEQLMSVAARLGLTKAEEYLSEQLAYYRKWHGPKPLHPEQLEGEVHLANMDPAAVRYIGWRTKRAGAIAFNHEGKIVDGRVPVFVAATELAQAGQLTDRMTVAP